MFCENCGTENTEGGKFCKNCGSELVNSETNDVKQPEQKVPSQEVPSQQTIEQQTFGQAEPTKIDVNKYIEKIKALPKKVLIGCAAGLALLVVIICIAINISHTINLNKYMTIETTGYNGYGHANVIIDWDAIEAKYGDKVSFTRKAKDEYGILVNLTTPMDELEGSVGISLDTYDTLSNGDKISYTWNVDKDMSEYLKCKVKFKNGTFKVSDLEKIDTFDAFSDLNVSFEGMSPNGNVVYEYTGSELTTYDFNCEKSTGLKNGDKVKIYISEDNIEYYTGELGKIPSKFEMEYTVEGLDEYVGSYSDLTKEFLGTVKGEAEDSIYAYTASSYNANVSVENLTYAGYIMNTRIDGSEYASSYNDLFIIYTATVSSATNDFSPTTVYFPVRFCDVIKSGDALSYRENYGIVGTTSLGGFWYSTSGYTNPLNCYLDIVEGNKENYNSEIGDGFEVYSEYNVVSKLGDISDANRALIQATAKAEVESYIAKSYNGGSVATNLAYVGEYLLYAKNEDSGVQNKNLYVVVLTATVSDEDGRIEPTTVYFPVMYEGVVKLSGDQYVISSNKGIQGHSRIPGGFYTTDGYVDGTVMYTDIVSANRDNYTYEISEGLKQFGN